MLQSLYTWDTLDFCTPPPAHIELVSMVSVFVLFATCLPHPCTTIPQIIPHFDIQMTTWSFRDALEELEKRGHFKESVLQSTLGLHLGDICFAEIQTSIKMHVVWFSTFLRCRRGVFQPRPFGSSLL